ncbi:hypothetical protein DPMN_111390 [Dreissena polymorpha]|uniref:Uncharacterized protein n=1 Tax=Dreissena polymorpha TaxID=45954 RepID=A0A9D4KEC4_DREPO|nr:hypothetical protein DPMN_111390 [Dreissena polymorpha]
MMASCKPKKSQSSVVGLLQAKCTFCLLPTLECVWSNLGVQVSFDNEYVFLGELDYDALLFFIERFNLLVFIVSCYCVDLDDCNVVRFR